MTTALKRASKINVPYQTTLRPVNFVPIITPQNIAPSTVPFHNVVNVDILPGCIVVRLASGVPADKVKPVVLGGRRCGKLEITNRSMHVDPGRQGTILVLQADLAALLSRAVLRLQIWVEGYLVWDRDFPTHNRELVGRIEAVRDYCLTGWVAHLLGESVPALELLVDGVSVAAASSTVTQHALNRYVSPPACIGFRIPLPARALDGAAHDFRVQIGDQATLAVRWQAKPQFQITARDNDSALIQFIDVAMADQPMTISALVEGHRIHSALATLSEDMPFQSGRPQSGFVARFPLPSAASIVTSGIELRAGRDAQLAFATLYLRTPASLAFHRIAVALRRVEQTLGLPAHWGQERLAELQSRKEVGRTVRPYLHVEMHRPPGGVSVLVPVYKGVADTRACLDSLADDVQAETNVITEIILIDDCSPDPAMRELLRDHPDRHMYRRLGIHVQVLRNACNQGFVASVNIGLAAAASGNDILLLNSDTVVPIGFARRLQAAAYSRPDIASVTPLSNDATILSVPDRVGGNAIGSELVATLDAFLQTRAGGRTCDIPVGVGFCMLLKSAALADVGVFGTEWGRGYCEEVDWCLRAGDRGWTHVAAVDTFVHHRGSVSFGSDERALILRRNHAILEQRYPEYIGDLKAYISNDALQDVRRDIFCLLLHQAGLPCLVHFTHNLGGGTDKLVDTLVDRFAEAGGVNLVCGRVMDDWLGEPAYEVKWRERNLTLRFDPVSITNFVLGLEKLGLPGIALAVHSLTGVGPEIYAVTAATAAPYVVYIHDYQWYCPRVVLVDHTQKYCGEPTTQTCQICVRSNSFFDFAEDNVLIEADLPRWIAQNAALLERAHDVVVPSHDTARRIAAHFPTLAPRCVPHPETVEWSEISRVLSADRQTRIAVVGGISVQKGAEVLRNLALYIDATDAAVSIEVIGTVADSALFAAIASITISGSYRPEELPARLAQFDPHFVFFPGVWPETYSFVLSEVWAAGYSAVAFDIGAVAERIRATGAGMILPFETTPEVLLPRLVEARGEVAALAGLVFEIGRKPTMEDDPISDLFGPAGHQVEVRTLR